MRVEVFEPDTEFYITQAWQIKEEIKEENGLLKQDWDFFRESYRNSRVFCVVERTELLGFASIRENGYLLFLAVKKGKQGDGIGKQLMNTMKQHYRTIDCHVRKTNTNAIEFYKAMGFKEQETISGYYSDGGDAYKMTLENDKA